MYCSIIIVTIQVAIGDSLDTSSENGLPPTKTVEIAFIKWEFDNLLFSKTYKNKQGVTSSKISERTYPVLKNSEWQTLVTNKLWEKAKIECSFNYKGHNIYLTTNRGTFDGQWTCGASIHGNINDLDNEVVTATCKISQGRGKFGNKYLRAAERENIGKELY